MKTMSSALARTITQMDWQPAKRAAVSDLDASPTLSTNKRPRLESDEPSSTGPVTTTLASLHSARNAPPSVTSATSISSSKRPKKYVCDYEDCGKAFDRPVRLQAHIRTHTGDRPFICKEDGCDKAFFKSEHLKAHMQNKHSDEATHVCAHIVQTYGSGQEVECGKAFTTASRLRRHAAIHEKAEELTCREVGCGQVFRKMETLQRHIKQDHLHEKAFRCAKIVKDASSGQEGEECGKSFSSAGQLQAHQNREHAGDRYFCSVCTLSSDGRIEAGFPTYAEYQSHLKIEHPPTCGVCGKICDSNRALTAHMEIEHSSLVSRQEKYRCDYPDCGRGFTRRGNLNVHVQSVHIKKRDFVCGTTDLGNNDKVPGWNNASGCGSAFTTKASFENHVRTQHLHLPSLYHPRKATRSKHEDEMSIRDEHPDILRADLALGLLTGANYAESRPIACWMADCPVRFTRNYDLTRHLELSHHWNIDDVYEGLAESEALGGGQFWIGGAEEEVWYDTMPAQKESTPPLSQQTDLCGVPPAFALLDDQDLHMSDDKSFEPLMRRNYNKGNDFLDPMLVNS